MIVTVNAVVRDEGTIVVFRGETAEGRVVDFGVDHRMARGLVDVLLEGDLVDAEVEDWAVIG